MAVRAERVVVIKVDGLPPRLLQQYLEETSSRRGREGVSLLPWMEHVFVKGGTRVANFYVRGLSLSAPSWSMLDTGRHLEIRGNVEYDRYTLRAYDYLNFFPFYFKAGVGDRVDMSGVELLDEYGVHLLIDRFEYGEWFQGAQLLQRGVNWRSLDQALLRTFRAETARGLVDEWQVGFAWAESWDRQNEEDLIEALSDPRMKYLELFSGEYDHEAHLARDPVTQFHAIEKVDALVGRVWSAILETPLAGRTALVLVSDHGMNTSPTVYSQGFNLVDWFTREAGGTHHVLTNRHPLTEFKIKSLDPFVSAVVTPSNDTRYLKGAGEMYPTAMLDLDGNERACIGLRNNTLNVLHVLLAQLLDKRIAGAVRTAALTAFFETIDSVRAAWSADLSALGGELADVDQRIAARQVEVDTKPKKWTPEQIARGEHREFNRRAHQLTAWKEERLAYGAYAAVIAKLLALTPSDFDPGKFKIGDFIPSRSLGPSNTLWDLRHYVTGPAAGGLVLDEDGRLDGDKSFSTIDYFAAFRAIQVRNNVQEGVGPEPIDFLAVRLGDRDAAWLWKDDAHQALVLRGPLGLRYLPVAGLEMDASGALRYDVQPWGPGFPLALYEDLRLDVPDRASWLRDWHTEREWLWAVHRTRYSNGLIGIVEQLLEPANACPPYEARKRRLRRTDLLVFAKDHWNFNVRGFNPGGNHGSFLRDATHSVLMAAGAGIPEELVVEQPYDSLSFAPTVLALMGREEAELPGPVIREMLGG